MAEKKLHLDASACVGTDGSAISSFVDTSGYVRNFTQSGGSRPALYLRALAGRPGVLFDGSDDSMTGQGVLSQYFGASAFSVLCVFKPLAVDTNSATIYSNDAIWTVSNGYAGMYLRSAPDLYAYVSDSGGDKSTSKSISKSDVVVASMYLSGGTLYLSVNGGSYGSVSSGPPNVMTGVPQIGVSHSGGYYFRGYLGELVIYDAVPSDLATLYSDLRNKYAITRPANLGDARERLSLEARRWRAERAEVSVTAPAAAALGLAPGTAVSMAHSLIPSPHGVATAKDWARFEGTLTRVEPSPETDTMRLILRDRRRYLCSVWYVPAGLLSAPSLGIGVARLGTGQAWAHTRSTPAWVEEYDGHVVEVPVGFEGFDRGGQLSEGTGTPLLLNSAFAEGATSWTCVNAAVDTAVRFAEPAVSPQTMKLTYSGGVATITQAVASVTARYLYLACDHMEDGLGAATDWRLQRSTDSKYYDASDGTWKVADTVNFFTTRTGSFTRDYSGLIDKGSTTSETLTLRLRNGTSGSSWIGWVDFTAGRWPGSRILTRAAADARAATSQTIANNSSLTRSWPNAHGTIIAVVDPWWTSSEIDTATMVVAYAYHDASNYWLLQYAGASGAWQFVCRAAGSSVTATKTASVTRGTRVTVAGRWTGTSGELGLAPYTIDVFVDGVQGTSATAAALPTETSPSSVYVGTDTTNHLNGRLCAWTITPTVLTATEIAGGA